MPGQTIGVIGLGIMGSAVSPNLLKDGFDVIGYDLLIERARALETQGGRGATSVRAVAEEAPVMISLLPSVHALEDVVSSDGGLVRAGRAGSVLLECSTLPLECKGAARRALERVGIVVLDCPLSGTAAQALTKDVVVYASGDEAAFERLPPRLRRLRPYQPLHRGVRQRLAFQVRGQPPGLDPQRRRRRGVRARHEGRADARGDL